MKIIIWILVGVGILTASLVGRLMYRRLLRKIPGAAVKLGKTWGATTDRYRALRALNSFFYITGMAVTLSGIIFGFVILLRPSPSPTHPESLPSYSQPTTPDNVLNPVKILELVNEQRRQHNLKPLVADPILTAIAEHRAKDMAVNEYYAHADLKGEYYYDLFPKFGIKTDYSCENLDVEFTTDESRYVNDWLESTKGHKKCMLHNKVTHAGYAAALFGGSKDIYIVVAVHAVSPQRLPIETPVTPQVEAQ